MASSGGRSECQAVVPTAFTIPYLCHEPNYLAEVEGPIA